MDIRRLTSADLDAVLRLVDLAGWNQTDRDLQCLLTLEPDGCFAAWADGRLVGTTTTTTYGTDLAWVGMVLVDPAYRRRGIATSLMETALDYLHWRGVKTIKLDATPEGRLVYEWLGFEAESSLERWAGTGVPAEDCFEITARPGKWEDIAPTDRSAFGADRSALMNALITDSGPPLVDAGGAAYAFARRGRRAVHRAGRRPKRVGRRRPGCRGGHRPGPGIHRH